MVAFRDLKVSQDIAKWAELGKFEQEFIVYGCSYLKDGERYYHISNQIAEVCHFTQVLLLEGICATPVIEWLNRVLVPSGLQEEYANISKLKLAQRMQVYYPKEFFLMFDRIAQHPHNDSAWPILQELQHAMIACFDHKILELADGIALIAFQQKKLTRSSYDMFRSWIEDRYLQMADDVVIKKDAKRTFYGFTYRSSSEKVLYYCNAFESEAYKRRNILMCQGKFCTPIINETFYYDQMPDVAAERKKFLDQLSFWMDDEYWTIINRICHLPSPVSESEMDVLREYANGQEALENFVCYYECLWQ